MSAFNEFVLLVTSSFVLKYVILSQGSHGEVTDRASQLSSGPEDVSPHRLLKTRILKSLAISVPLE